VVLEDQARVLPIGKGELLQDGRDLAILALGSTVVPALEASELLARRGISCAVADARFVKPLDDELICGLARRVGGIVTVEEHAATGGFGSAVLELLAAQGCQVPVEIIAVPDEFVEHGKQSDLRSTYALDGPGIAQRALAAFPRLEAAAVS